MRCLFAVLAAFFLLTSFSATGYSEIGDKVPACRAAFQVAKQDFLKEIDWAENSYTQYRWSEFKIRIFQYGRLWKSRHESNDPLSREVRLAAEDEESRMLDELKRLDHKSKNAANRLHRSLKNLSAGGGSLHACCPDKEVKECYDESFLSVVETAKNIEKLFQTIYEGDRAYQKEVGLTIGGREGIYPEDTVEAPLEHGSFYFRYEIERRQHRFEEEVRMAESFQDLRKILLASFAGDLCCLRCGKTDWSKKEALIFDAPHS